MNRGFTVGYSIVSAECKIAWRARAQWLHPFLYYCLIATLFPLALQPETSTLQLLGPAVIWVSALLANLLGLERLFARDAEQGCLDQWALSQTPLALIAFLMVLTHWLVIMLPLLLITPLIAASYHLAAGQVQGLLLSLLLGSPILCFVGAIGQALLARCQQGGMLLALLLIPLYIPVLILGAGSVATTDSLHSFTALILLAALAIVSLVFAPFAIAGSLRLAI